MKRLFAVPNLNAHAISNVFTPVWRCLLIPYYASSDKLMDNILRNAPLLTPSLAWAEARDILAGVERKIDCQVLALMPFLSLPDVGIYCKRL